MSLYRFPENPGLRSASSIDIQPENLKCTNTSAYANHFEESYVKSGSKHISSGNAVPASFSTHEIKYAVEKGPTDGDYIDDSTATSQEAENCESSGEEPEHLFPLCEESESIKSCTLEKESTMISSVKNNKSPGCAPYVCYLSSCTANAIPNSSEEVLKRKLKSVTAENEKARKQLKLLQQKYQRNSKKIARLEEVIGSFKENRVIDDDTLELMKAIPGPDRESLLHQLCTEQSLALQDKTSQDYNYGEYFSDASDYPSESNSEES